MTSANGIIFSFNSIDKKTVKTENGVWESMGRLYETSNWVEPENFSWDET